MTNVNTYQEWQNLAVKFADVADTMTHPAKYITSGLERERVDALVITIPSDCARCITGSAMKLYTLWVENCLNDSTALRNWNYWKK